MLNSEWIGNRQLPLPNRSVSGAKTTGSVWPDFTGDVTRVIQSEEQKHCLELLRTMARRKIRKRPGAFSCHTLLMADGFFVCAKNENHVMQCSRRHALHSMAAGFGGLAFQQSATCPTPCGRSAAFPGASQAGDLSIPCTAARRMWTSLTSSPPSRAMRDGHCLFRSERFNLLKGDMSCLRLGAFGRWDNQGIGCLLSGNIFLR